MLSLRDNIDKWYKVFKNGPSKICRRQRLKNLKGYDLLLDLCKKKVVIFMSDGNYSAFFRAENRES